MPDKRPLVTAAQSEQALLRAELLLEASRASSESREARRLRRRRSVRKVMNRILLVVGAWVAITIGAFAFSAIVTPLGFWGLLIVPLLMLLAALLILRLPGWTAPAERAAFADVSVDELPRQVDRWLDTRRAALPAPARAEIDRILLQLDALAPELPLLAADGPERLAARRLMADHLPRLVETWEAIPPLVRQKDRDAQQHLKDGLRLVGDELARLNGAIGASRLEALEVEGRFLENRYRTPGALEG